MKFNLSQFVTNTKNSAVKHAPEILTIVGVAGMIGTIFMVAKETPKALDVMTELKEEAASQNREVSGKDILTHVGPVYLPAVVTGVASASCIIGASAVNHKRNAALLAAYTISETALKEYRDKVVETIGEKKEQSIQEAVARDHVAKNPVRNTEVFITQKGNTLFYDCMTGRYFESDLEKIEKSLISLNNRLMREHYISLDELYYEWGLRPVQLGNELGWNVENGMIEITKTPQLTEDDRPCIAISFPKPPGYRYASNYR